MLRLDHVNIRCSDLDGTRSFLQTVMGLTPGARPDFPVPGYWMYDKHGHACAHLTEAPGDLGPAGAIDHIAFYFDDLTAQVARMEAAGYPVALRPVPGTDIQQGFIEGPDGIGYEVQGRG